MASGQIASVVADELPAQSPARKTNDAPRRGRTPEDDITKALGAEEYIADHRFEWAREKLWRIGVQDYDEGPRYSFSRYYRKQRVIVDLIPFDTDKARALVKAKRDVLFDWNAAHPDEKLGYLPIMPYQRVTRLNFESVLSGQLVDLPSRIIDPRLELEKGFAK
jgi:hypothetical protein